jgi:hypothetical protein
VHSKPASISVFRRIGHLSVTTRCESFSVFANVLPNVLDEMSPDLPSVQEEPYRDLPKVLLVYRNLPNVQDEPYHDLPGVQDEPYPPEYRPHVGAHAQSRKVLLTDLVHFCQYRLIQFLHTLSQRVSPYWLLFTRHLVPLLRLLVHFVSNAYTVFEHAYLFPENQHHAAVLVHIEIMRFFQRSHDFRTQLKNSY